MFISKPQKATAIFHFLLTQAILHYIFRYCGDNLPPPGNEG
jgi:hypothetical protein